MTVFEKQSVSNYLVFSRDNNSSFITRLKEQKGKPRNSEKTTFYNPLLPLEYKKETLFKKEFSTLENIDIEIISLNKKSQEDVKKNVSKSKSKKTSDYIKYII